MKRRVLVVEDSLTVRRRLCDVLSSDPELEVVGEAGDGKLAIELCERLRPDVVTLDMVLPVMSGVAATEHIMAHFPTPILIVSSSTNRGELFDTYDALAAGAVDVFEKPTGCEQEGDWERRFVSTVKIVARVKVITHPRARLRALGHGRAAKPEPAQVTNPNGKSEPPGSTTPIARLPVLALGASTGGPAAIVEILRALPSDLPAAILFVIHIDEPFSAAFVDWLDRQSHYQVSYARDGEPLSSIRGRVAMAPPGQHMMVEGKSIRLSSAPERHSCRPSIDVLFESLAQHANDSLVGCLLTGMGRDGALGLLAIRRAGGLTIAQDEASSIVYGMPREAALLDAADEILPLQAIGPALAREVQRLLRRS
jgi:two-component system chemotaxis response regulator CheB